MTSSARAAVCVCACGRASNGAPRAAPSDALPAGRSRPHGSAAGPRADSPPPAAAAAAAAVASVAVGKARFARPTAVEARALARSRGRWDHRDAGPAPATGIGPAARLRRGAAVRHGPATRCPTCSAAKIPFGIVEIFTRPLGYRVCYSMCGVWTCGCGDHASCAAHRVPNTVIDAFPRPAVCALRPAVQSPDSVLPRRVYPR